MAAPLESSSSYGGSKTRNATPAEAKKPEAIKEMPNQRLGLLHALLSVGALRPAISIISKFPWMVDAFPELSDLMIRVLNYSINDIYESALTFKKDTMASFTKAKPRFGSSGLVPAAERKPHITLIAPKPPPTSAINFVFFFPEWTQYIPVCSTEDDLIDVLEPLMRFIGPQISRDHMFLTRFLRTGRPHITSIVCTRSYVSSVSRTLILTFYTQNITDPETKKSTMIEDKENPVRKFWTMVVRRYLLPALCLTQGNAVSTVDIWNIVKMFDVHTRWRFYGEWRSLYKTHPELRVREIQVDRESKGVLRRLSVKTVESLSGTVAKLAHSNPYIFFANVVNQVMAYDNLANVIISSLTHVTVMGFDVLLYIVLDALANPHKERVKQDGINTSDWLQSMCSHLRGRFAADSVVLRSSVVHRAALPPLQRRPYLLAPVHRPSAARRPDQRNSRTAGAYLEDGGHRTVTQSRRLSDRCYGWRSCVADRGRCVRGTRCPTGPRGRQIPGTTAVGRSAYKYRTSAPAPNSGGSAAPRLCVSSSRYTLEIVGEPFRYGESSTNLKGR